jgi:hypothetical protein
VAIETEQSRRSIELRKIEGELERLREEHRQAERSNRQGTYHRLLALLTQHDMIGTGAVVVDEGSYNGLVEELHLLRAGLQLFGAQRVTDAAEELQSHLAELGKAMARVPGAATRIEQFRAAYPGTHREAIVGAEGRLIAAMRQDVTRGIHEEAN